MQFHPHRQNLIFYIASIAGTLLLALLLLGLRFPEYLSHPTLFAEDGRTYFSYAFNSPWTKGLLAERQGYYALWSNAVSVIAAKLFPLACAPYVILCGAYAVFALMAALVVSPASPFPTQNAKIIALLLMVLLPPYLGIMPLSHTHFYFCISAGLILVSHPATRRARIAYKAILLFCGLSSPVAVFLLPVYGFAYLRSRSADRRDQLLLLALAGVAQMAAFYHSGQWNRNADGRFTNQFGIFLFWALNRSIVHPFFGWQALEACGTFMQKLITSQNGFYIPALMGSAVILICWIRLMCGLKEQSETTLLLTASYVTVAIVSFYTAYGTDKTDLLYRSHRYFVPSTTFMAWAFLIHACNARQASVRRFYRCLVGWLLLACAYTWLYEMPFLHAGCLHCDYIPDWQTEVEMWRQDPSHPVAILPEGWAIRLSPQALGHP